MMFTPFMLQRYMQRRRPKPQTPNITINIQMPDLSTVLDKLTSDRGEIRTVDRTSQLAG